MTKDEIENYISIGVRGAVCVYRERLLSLPLLVMSIYISGKMGRFILNIDFDPIDMVDTGEGWSWQSEAVTLEDIIHVLEVFQSKPLLHWENFNKAGKLSYYDENVDNEEYLQKETSFKTDMLYGEKLLPLGINWVGRP
ncbi:MAG TPA: hypothetical protein DHW71_05985 [Gammaproteobacteria bacterium]|nr:hypothetical protein [Gammaproteobacteria bacterium]HBF09410.1 hypothetical protein [Gammaproteobacteria bacterium]HCK92514.1 hypothetical protein [Gammaproteobacteria bacterium]|tara:strand:- start:4471 stop:4887 length:417 start_codon:yes stop_codon:yes gene_type:complete